jgi:hypothetical protein
MYRFLNRLRDDFDIQNKLEITEEKIRGLFGRWLEIVNDRLAEGHNSYRRLIIIVDGIDKFLDPSGKEERPDWLPYELPKNIKAIYTANTDSKASKYLMAKAKVVLHLTPLKVEHRQALLDKYLENFEIGEKVVMNDRIEVVREFISDPEGATRSKLYLNLLLSLVFVNMSNKFPFDDLQSVATIQSLLFAALDILESQNKKATQKILMCLALTKTGLTDDEIISASEAKQAFWYNM